MDITELLEQEKRKQELLAEEKVKDKLRRQIRIFNKEKEIFTHKVTYEVGKQRCTLNVLEKEKEVELENYLASRGRAAELKYMRQQAVVQDLVTATDKVKDYYKDEQKATRELENEYDKLTNKLLATKQATSDMNTRHSKIYVPCEARMDSRVEYSSAKFHQQLEKNKALEEKIDNAAYERQCFMKEAARLDKDIDNINKEITAILTETSEVYEKRDRAETTKLKVRDHLGKVRDRYQRELLSVSLTLSEDRKMETFMRTKHKDITQYLRHQREVETEKVEEMAKQKDEFTKAFDEIKQKTGKNDINAIIHDFIEAEEENFAIFQNIGEILDDNQNLRCEINNIRDKIIPMEDELLILEQQKLEDKKAAEDRTEGYKKKNDACQARMNTNNKVLAEYVADIYKILKLLDIDRATITEYLDEQGNIPQNHILDIMTVIEKTVSVILKDFYMVELATRALTVHKPDPTEDEVMLTRVPSLRIGHIEHAASKPQVNGKEKEKEMDDLEEEMKTSLALGHDMVKETVVRSLLETQASPQTGGEDQTLQL